VHSAYYPHDSYTVSTLHTSWLHCRLHPIKPVSVARPVRLPFLPFPKHWVAGSFVFNNSTTSQSSTSNPPNPIAVSLRAARPSQIGPSLGKCFCGRTLRCARLEARPSADPPWSLTGLTPYLRHLTSTKNTSSPSLLTLLLPSATSQRPSLPTAPRANAVVRASHAMLDSVRHTQLAYFQLS